MPHKYKVIVYYGEWMPDCVRTVPIRTYRTHPDNTSHAPTATDGGDDGGDAVCTHWNALDGQEEEEK